MAVAAKIYVERDTHKGIVIGRRGSMLKRIGTEAREQIRTLLGCGVHLDLHVSVDEGWTRDPRRLRALGVENA